MQGYFPVRQCIKVQLNLAATMEVFHTGEFLILHSRFGRSLAHRTPGCNGPYLRDAPAIQEELSINDVSNDIPAFRRLSDSAPSSTFPYDRSVDLFSYLGLPMTS